ncbi:hypothetical protein BC567DRAFT_225060 [Phyllosticta citribraziliensis]
MYLVLAVVLMSSAKVAELCSFVTHSRRPTLAGQNEAKIIVVDYYMIVSVHQLHFPLGCQSPSPSPSQSQSQSGPGANPHHVMASRTGPAGEGRTAGARTTTRLLGPCQVQS